MALLRDITGVGNIGFAGVPTVILGTGVSAAGGLDSTIIGANTAAAGSFTTFTSNGIDDNASSTAVTLDASGNATFNGSVAFDQVLIGTTLTTGDYTYRDTGRRVWQLLKNLPENSNNRLFRVDINAIRVGAFIKVSIGSNQGNGLAHGAAVGYYSISRQDGGAVCKPIQVSSAGSSPGTVSLSEPHVSGNAIFFGAYSGNNGTSTFAACAITVEIFAASPANFLFSEVAGDVAHSGTSLPAEHNFYSSGAKTLTVDGGGNLTAVAGHVKAEKGFRHYLSVSNGSVVADLVGHQMLMVIVNSNYGTGSDVRGGVYYVQINNEATAIVDTTTAHVYNGQTVTFGISGSQLTVSGLSAGNNNVSVYG